MIKKILEHRFFKDSFWTISALCILNVTIQFIIYPFLNHVLGAEQYGNTLFLISIINIVSVSIGISVNNRRMVASADSETQNAEYNLFLIIMSILLLPVSAFLTVLFKMNMGALQILLFWVLMCMTTWRYYADVEFRLKLNYKGYFAYYLFISIGYLLGMILFKATDEWTLILLPGETAGLIYVAWKGSIFKKAAISRRAVKLFLEAVMYLIASQLLIQLVFNADRFVLKLLSGGVAVTVYYIASLMGKTRALLTTPLNSVIIGYLAKSRKEMTAGRWTRIVGMCIIAGGVILLVCVAASHIVIRILYPSEFDMAEPLFMLANLAQIVYFMTGILTTILLRYVEERQQLNITLAYVIAFAAIVLPVTWKYKLWGFAYAILVVNTFRFIYVFFVMFKKIKGKKLRTVRTDMSDGQRR